MLPLKCTVQWILLEHSQSHANITTVEYRNVSSPARETPHLDYPGGPVDRSLTASAQDVGLIPSQGRIHMPWSNQACAPHYCAHVLQ